MPVALGTVASHRTATATGSVLPVTDGVTAWFDADDASAFTFGTGSAVAEWRSKIAATKLVQSDPTYRPPRTGTLNGRATLAFTAHALHGNPWPQSLGVESLFIVMVPRNNADGRYLLGCERNRGSLPRKLRFLGAKLHMDFAGGGTGTTTASPTLNVAVVYESVRNVPTHGVSGPWQLYFDGVLDTDTSSTYGGDYDDGTQDLGGDYYDYPDYGQGQFIGDIAEIVQYNRILSTVERQQVESYLYWKWMATPPPFTTTGLVGWWDADDAATITASSGLVSQWSNKAGSLHWVQSTGGVKPTTGANTLNGRNVLTFVAHYMDIADNPCAGAAGGTAFWVVKNSVPNTDGNATSGPISGFGSGGNDDFHPFASGYVYSRFGSTARPQMNAPADLQPAHVASLRSAPASWEWWLNGTSQYSNTSNVVGWGSAGGQTLGRNTVGSNYRGQIAEVILYNRALSTVERQQVESYLKTKWGTP